jgi:integrase
VNTSTAMRGTAQAAGRRRGGVLTPAKMPQSGHALPLPSPEKSLCPLPIASDSPHSPVSGLLNRTNCATLAPGQCVSGPGESMARRRFQKGSLFIRGKRVPKWICRWRDDVIEDGRVRRIYRSEVLGTLEEFPTRKLAEREFQARLSMVNDPGYRARPTATFQQFASRWESTVLSQHKPSHQGTVRSQLRKYLIPFFGRLVLREIRTEEVQRFLSGVKASPKTVRNLYITIRSMWKAARTWGYVAHEICEGVVLPKSQRARRIFFTLEEVQRIIGAAAEPHKTLYWLAAETGMRAGELTGLRLDDLDFDGQLVHVRQSAWHGKIQSPKTENAYRAFALSPQLCLHLAGFLRTWRPNDLRLLFATKGGKPWDSNLVVKRKLRPLLQSLGIEGGGLHAFRHANETMMDRLSVPLKVRQERLGHSDPRMTLGTYTHVASADDKRIAEQLGDLLSPTGIAKASGILNPSCTQVEAVVEVPVQQSAYVH